jgi:four helix bundle protein
MSRIRNAYRHKDLKVWQKSIGLVVELYRITNEFPSNEKYGLISQMRRSVVSIPSNIAEGHGRNSKKELIRFLDIAKGSIYELDTQIEISRQLGYIKAHNYNCLSGLLDEISRMLTGLAKSKNHER